MRSESRRASRLRAGLRDQTAGRKIAEIAISGKLKRETVIHQGAAAIDAVAAPALSVISSPRVTGRWCWPSHIVLSVRPELAVSS
ncbi:hypothetical protein GCM10022233_42520 [Streptomyces shaanxiensis]|uniref:Uncharacterized protein n=1 Tax=Streptomyces shaanxiensis TaxID=653357 RepID=A0ABP7VBZ4_9ACTN